MKIGVIGLGKLGLPLAVVLSQHYDVEGVDIIEQKIEDNEDKEIQTMDTSRLNISTDFSRIKDCDIIFNIVPTPSMKDGNFTNEYIYKSIDSVKEYLDENKLFVITSTVMPGSCKKFAEQIPCSICYNPEFIRLGTVAKDMVNPDFVLIGEDKKESGDILESIYKNIVTSPIKRMDLLSAEIAKITLNSYITMKISFANVLAEICDNVGGDAEKITDAIGCDRRIGHHYFKPQGAYGGPCFPRDNIAFSNVAGNIPNYAKLTDEINKHQAKRMGYASDDPRYRNILDE